MKIILEDKEKYIIRFDSGEELIERFAAFCEEKKISSGSFNAIGACSEVVISYYELEKKQYIDKQIKEDMEIIAVNGNVSKMGDKTIIHAHGCFSDSKMQAKAGHVKKMIVSATCEVALFVFNGKIERGPNEKIGLNLML